MDRRQARSTGTLLAAGWLLLLSATSAAAQEVRLVLAHGAAPSSIAHGLLLKPWAQRVAIASGGRLRIDLDPGSGPEASPRDLFDRLDGGTADLVWAPLSGRPDAFADLAVFELPFMAWPAEATSQAALAFRDRHAVAAGAGYRLLLAHSDAPAWIHTVSGPVRSLADLRGKRLAAATPSLRRFLEAAGAEAVATTGSLDLAAMLGRGELDGAVMSFAAAVPAGVAAAARYHTRLDRPPEADRTRGPGLGTTLFVLAMNAERFDSLPDDLRDLLRESADRTLAESAGRTWDSVDRLNRRKATADGHIFLRLSETERQRWQEAARPIVERWSAAARARGRDGPALLRAARILIARYHAGMAEALEARTRPARGKGG